MIAPELVERIEGLLKQGELSQRRIARTVGVSRGTVNAIALGRRPNYAARARSGTVEASPLWSGPLERCPGCGGLVYMPCLTCRTRAMKSRGHEAV